MKKSRGFSLPELIIAITLVAVLSLMVFMGFSTTFKASSKVNSDTLGTGSGQITVESLKNLNNAGETTKYTKGEAEFVVAKILKNGGWKCAAWGFSENEDSNGVFYKEYTNSESLNNIIVLFPSEWSKLATKISRTEADFVKVNGEDISYNFKIGNSNFIGRQTAKAVNEAATPVDCW